MRHTLFLSFFISQFLSLAWADNSPIPDKIIVTVDGTKIEGWFENPDIPIESEIPWKPEGFIYRPQSPGLRDFKITAWSSRGRAGRILSKAEDQILDLLQKASKPGEEPAGYETSEHTERHIGKKKSRQYPSKLTVLESQPTVTPTPSTSPAPTLVLEEPRQQESESKNSRWPWILLAAILLLLILATPLRSMLLKLFK
jgi:hypothetical protein